jgi:hypothetical protein
MNHCLRCQCMIGYPGICNKCRYEQYARNFKKDRQGSESRQEDESRERCQESYQEGCQIGQRARHA